MKYKLLLDENNFLLGFVHTNTSEDTYEMNPSTMELDYLNCYKLTDGVLVLDEEKKAAIIAEEEAKEEHEEKVEAQTRNLAEMFISNGEDSTDFMDRIDAQVLYTALMTDSLIEEGE